MQPESSLSAGYRPDSTIQSIQIMRGIAALLVVLLHISVKGEQYGNGALKGFTIGGCGVDLFFIISGYIMCASTLDRHLSPSQFFLLRIKRIIPLYWLTTTVALFVYLYNPGFVNASGGETSIWASYALIPNGKRFLNSNGWTLSYEFFYYLIFACFIFKGTFKAMKASTIILLILVMVGLFYDREGLLFGFSTNILYIEFVFGMGCYYLFNRKNIRLNNMKNIRLKPQYGIVLFVLGCLLLAGEHYFGIPGQEKGRGYYWGIPMLGVFTGLLSLEDIFKRSMSRLKRLFLAIGDSSYSLYLIHPFTLSGTAMCLKRLGLASNPYLFSIILLAISVIIGHLVYLFVERPLINLVKGRSVVKS